MDFLPTCTLSPFAGSRLPHRTAELRSAPPRPRDHAVSGPFPGPPATATFSPGVLIHSSPHRFETSVKGSDPAGEVPVGDAAPADVVHEGRERFLLRDRKSTRLNSSHVSISYAVFCLKKKI